MADVSNVLKAIQDTMRKDAGVDGDAQRIGQLVWMFFLKIFDDREEELVLLDEEYRSPIPENLRWSAWAADVEGITGDDLLLFVNNELFPGLKNINIDVAERSRALVVHGVFQDAINYMKSGTLLRQVINKINTVDFNNLGDRHTFGDVYEQILRDLQSAGNAGEFYTPRALTQFMVEMVDPKLSDIVFDPACGTGGFLSCAVDHKTDLYVNGEDDYEVLQSSIRGVEKKALPHLLCTTNMMLHGIESPTSIVRGNTLSKPIKDHPLRKKVDVILTNPPFGGIEEDGIERNVPQLFQTRETADLFLVLIIELLKDGGRAAVVLPDGTLFGEGTKTRIKEKLLAECNLHTIVRLPNGVFNPYTGIKTNLLFFEKGSPTKDVWFYEHPYPDGYKNYSKSRPIRLEEFDSEKAWWGDATRAGRKQTQNSWKVGIEDIKARGYNLDIPNPFKPDADARSIDELTKAYDHSQHQLVQASSALLTALQSALGQFERSE
ncbi:DNA methyltransferase [Burkholderia sp. WAC0059]|uniref:class I SAM-dependent DNA methyltransferase n=1 Tax=Burkholderia sp. WAC0059 TaxID=2066022 RepID=UPI000C7F45E5|nr:class I SAM-dependent DNA methyltransferase [Burkholderia sp. WAC0059]PLZ01952.1 DNA methyltransferase [Burkholderia sp. WAC0059]